MSEDSIKFTSFVTPLGQFECLRMPFGLKGAPLKFQRYVTHIFRELIDSGDVVVYLDDFLVATTTLEHHFEVLEKTLRLLVENRLELRLDKCRFVQTTLEYLGYVITEAGIQPTDRGVAAVQDFPKPRNVHEVQSFLGLCSYFRKFIENFSIIAKPLSDLTRKDVPFQLGHDECKAFHLLKEKLTQAPILSIYSPCDETELHCDASTLGFGAVLMQRKADRKFHPVFYFSKRTTSYESKYHSFELETLAIIYALRRFRTYLQGVKFKVVTDCQALTQTLNKKDTNPRIARWVLELQGYDYTVEHRAGSKMPHVDALSRSACVLVLEDNSFDRNLVLSQDSDTSIVKLREKLAKVDDSFFEMRNGLIYRKVNDRILFYVPKAMEHSVMYKYHNELGHVGLDKALENIQRSYWFPQMRLKIKDHIRACLKCIAFSAPSGKMEGFVHNIPKSDRPFKDLHIDHLGPISKSHSTKYRYVLLIVDGFSKFLKLYPTKSTSTHEVINCLRGYFTTYSRPVRMISDRGSCFTSQQFAEFLQENNIRHVKIATASPQANGQVERMNRTIMPMIAKLTDERRTHWYNVLSDVEFACNNTVSRSTGECPSVLLFGIGQKGTIIDGLREALESSDVIKPVRNLEKTREQARARIEQTQAKSKDATDKRRKAAHTYAEGDRIMIRNFVTAPGISSKLLPRFKGPYQVKRVLRNDRYVIKDVDGFQVSQSPYQGTWAAANMRPWNPKVALIEAINSQDGRIVGAAVEARR